MPEYDPATALIVVDVQNDFADPGGSLYVKGGEAVAERCAAEGWRASQAGVHIGRLCEAIHRRLGQVGVRRIQGVLSLAKKFGAAVVDEACAAALELGVHEYHFVRRYLERGPQLPLALHQVDPLIRQLVEYRDIIHQRTKEQ